MPAFLLIFLTQQQLAALGRCRWRTRSRFLCGLGLLVMLAACGRTPMVKTAPQGDASTTLPPAIATPPHTTTEIPIGATPDRDRRSHTDPSPPSTAPETAPVVSSSPGDAVNPAPPANPPQSSTHSASGVPDVLRPAIDTLRNQTQIPVLLPDRLPLPDEPIYASTRAAADRYTIDLGYVPDCRGNACMIGTIAARRGSGDYYELEEPFAQTIELADGTPAYFNPSVCGASCAPPVLEWEYGGARYRVELKGLSEVEALEALATLANSAIAAGDRLR